MHLLGKQINNNKNNNNNNKMYHRLALCEHYNYVSVNYVSVDRGYNE